MDFAPFASAVVHSMRCQPSVRAQYSAAVRLRARYSVSFLLDILLALVAVVSLGDEPL